MSMIKSVAFMATTVLLLSMGTAFAEVMNGDFENGGDQWQVNVPANWTSAFPAAGGNPGGFATIQSPFGGQGGLGLISQTFMCGDPNTIGTCTITVDYSLLQIDASSNSGRIYIRIDGVASTFAPDDDNWYMATFTRPCGVHVIDLGLEVDPLNNGWRASFDNVVSVCDGDVPNEPINWGNIKAMYR
jgi:hypothetical protein